MIKKLKWLAFVTTCLAIGVANAQTLKDEMQALGAQNQEWNIANLSNLLKKTPFNVKDLTAEQLADNSKANPLEVQEIKKAIQHRDLYQKQYAQIVTKYITPPEAGREMIQNGANFMNKINGASEKLISGQITYGEYNQIKQSAAQDANVKGRAIADKYGLFKPSATPQPQSQPAKPLIDRSSPNAFAGSCYAISFALIGRKDKNFTTEEQKTLFDAMSQFKRMQSGADGAAGYRDTDNNIRQNNPPTQDLINAYRGCMKAF